MVKASFKQIYLPYDQDPVGQAMARRRVIIDLISKSIDEILKQADLSFIQGSKLKLEFKVDLEEGKMEIPSGHRVTSGEFSLIDLSFLPDEVDPHVAMLFRRIIQSKLSTEYSYNRPDGYFKRPY